MPSNNRYAKNNINMLNIAKRDAPTTPPLSASGADCLIIMHGAFFRLILVCNRLYLSVAFDSEPNWRSFRHDDRLPAYMLPKRGWFSSSWASWPRHLVHSGCW